MYVARNGNRCTEATVTAADSGHCERRSASAGIEEGQP